MTRVIYERRTITEACHGKPFTRIEKHFRFAFVAMLFCAYVEVLGPGACYERARFA
jgi:hypothetical protein